MYFYNGAGVAAADLNNDSLVDLVFTSNQGKNKLYLNKGNLKFDDVSAIAGLDSNSWSTGVNIIDINQDGLKDIYICQVDNGAELRGHNLLYIAQRINEKGIPIYIESAKEYGLDFSGYSTQSAFFDYDLDGDLDMYLLNHSVHKNGTFGERKNHSGKFHDTAGDRLYRNDGKKYTDVTKTCGINSNALGYGLGIKVSDINLDGFPDIYIGNDFHENDYLYINQKNGTFKDELDAHIMHTSRFTMGVDIADFNNDLFPDIFSLDMLPDNYEILKRSEAEDLYNIYLFKLSQGYNHQYTRNALQLNRKNGFFSEIGLFSGVAASDWSWSTFFNDFDNDGYKDIFISNGIPRRMNDIDYIDFIVDDIIQSKIRTKKFDESDLELLGKLPEIKINNKFFINNHDLTFKDYKSSIKGDKPSFSNGAVYADLDNDGDVEIITNNINQEAFIYKNETAEQKNKKARAIYLNGKEKNSSAVGAKIICHSGKDKQWFENFNEKGFMSSMNVPLYISSTTGNKIDSLTVIWPDNTFETFKKIDTSAIKITLDYRSKLPVFDYKEFYKKNTDDLFTKPSIETEITHKENSFEEFSREFLLLNMTSTEGPAMTIEDINNDGFEDIFIGGSRYKTGKIYLQDKKKQWTLTEQPEIENDSVYEDTDAVFIDINNDEFKDLIIGSGGSEFYTKSEYNVPRVYINDGTGLFKKQIHSFDKNIQLTCSKIITHDFSGDGYVDLFITSRSMPWAYGESPAFYFFNNDGKGNFINSTAHYVKNNKIGMVTDAVHFDYDKDGDLDILCAVEWDYVKVLKNTNGKYQVENISISKGLWSCIDAKDIDGDGDIDVVVGNHGLNSKLHANESQALTMYYDDFDKNGRKEQFITYYHTDKEVPFATVKELHKQMPSLKKKFLYASDFAKMKLTEIIDKNKLDNAQKFIINELRSIVLFNNENQSFTERPLPDLAQWSVIKDLVISDINDDGKEDVIIAGNYYESNSQLGRFDADPGIVLLNTGQGNFEAKTFDQPILKGQSRKILIKNKRIYIAKNNGKLMVVYL